MAEEIHVEVFASEMAEVPARDLDVAWEVVGVILGSPGDWRVNSGELLVGRHGWASATSVSAQRNSMTCSRVGVGMPGTDGMGRARTV